MPERAHDVLRLGHLVTISSSPSHKQEVRLLTTFGDPQGLDRTCAALQLRLVLPPAIVLDDRRRRGSNRVVAHPAKVAALLAAVLSLADRFDRTGARPARVRHQLLVVAHRRLYLSWVARASGLPPLTTIGTDVGVGGPRRIPCTEDQL